MIPADAWRICLETETAIHDSYHDGRVAMLLFGTAAQESGLTYRRQCGVNPTSYIGGFGLWQLECGSIRDSIARVRQSPMLVDRVARYLGNTLATSIASNDWKYIARAMTTPGGDYLSCVFSRLHYLRVAAPIPKAPLSQSEYWKEHYNTSAGAGTPSQYVRNWQALCLPEVSKWVNERKALQAASPTS